MRRPATKQSCDRSIGPDGQSPDGVGNILVRESENASYKCCRHWQKRVEAGAQKCIIGTGGNC